MKTRLSAAMAGGTERQQVSEGVCLAMSLNSKGTERHNVVNIQRLAVFFGRLSAVAAYLISLSHCAPRWTPSRTIVGFVSAHPIKVVLACHSACKHDQRAVSRAGLPTLKVASLGKKVFTADRARFGDRILGTVKLAAVVWTAFSHVFSNQPLTPTFARAKASPSSFWSSFKNFFALFANRSEPSWGEIWNVRDAGFAAANIRTIFTRPAKQILKRFVAGRASFGGPL